MLAANAERAGFRAGVGHERPADIQAGVGTGQPPAGVARVMDVGRAQWRRAGDPQYALVNVERAMPRLFDELLFGRIEAIESL